MDRRFILAIDQGTSGTKTIVVNALGKIVAKASLPLNTSYLPGGMVEQNPEEIFQNVLSSVKQCITEFENKGGNRNQLATCGISNQRETFIVWDKSGKPLSNAVVWQCKRSIGICERLKEERIEKVIKQKTGLLIDPYFSGTKLIWLYENVTEVRTAIDQGNAYFGTVDAWLLFKLSNGKNYCTDYTNASRTLFFNLTTLSWDQELLESFGLSKLNLPACKPSSSSYGETDFNGLLQKAITINAMIGDSHAAAFGECCFTEGTAKATLGTGCSILMNVGNALKYSEGGMVSTICWSTEEQVQFALEGVIVTCGATIEWLKKELNLIDDSKQTEAMATLVEDNNGVYLVPAFSGLGAPHWDMSRKASIVGLTFNSTKNHIVRAALESIAYQIKDVLVAMEEDTHIELTQLMVDGGISSNNFVIQFLSDLLQKDVITMGTQDVSALGAAYLSGLKAGIFESIDQVARLNTDLKIHQPGVQENMNKNYDGWKNAIGLRRTKNE